MGSVYLLPGHTQPWTGTPNLHFSAKHFRKITNANAFNHVESLGVLSPLYIFEEKKLNKMKAKKKKEKEIKKRKKSWKGKYKKNRSTRRPYYRAMRSVFFR